MDKRAKSLPFDMLCEHLELIGRILPVGVVVLDENGAPVIQVNAGEAFWVDRASRDGEQLGQGVHRITYYWEYLGEDVGREDAEALMKHLGKEYNYMSVLQGEPEEGTCSDTRHRVTMTDSGEDILTGVFNREYFMNRIRVIDRAEVIPVALICVNINDWKYANVNYGNEESDRLIRIVAGILKQEAKPEYVIGRTDGDVFHVVIPMVEESEDADYIGRIQKACREYADPHLSPSVACGSILKYNVEQHLEELFDDVQYLMFENKLEMKQEPGYRERLYKK